MKKTKIKSIKSLGKQKTYNMTMASEQHNYALFGEKPEGKFVISKNSHACAYTYTSMKMLYLKTHFPHEFFTATLAYEHITEKIKQYKMETQNHGIEVCRVDINKSKETFTLIGDVIYFGFGKIKGVGEEAAKQIVANQPYTNFEDFVFRSGSDASVIKRLIGLRCFNDSDPITLWKFVEYYKNKIQKFKNSKRTNTQSLSRYQEEFDKLTNGDVTQLHSLPEDYSFDQDLWKKRFDHDEEKIVEEEIECEPNEGGEGRFVTVKIPVGDDDSVVIEREELKYFKTVQVTKNFNRWRALKTLWNRYKKARTKKIEIDLPKLMEFNAGEWPLASDVVKELRDPEACEREYYGFEWVHDLEKSPDYKGDMTFERLKNSQSSNAAPVEMKVIKVTKKESKKKKDFFFWQIDCEDVTGTVAKMNIWSDDWERWEPEFQEGNLLRVRVQPPSGGYPTFTFDSPPKHLRWKVIPKRKEDDFRVFVMRPAIKQLTDVLTDEEVMEQFDV